MKGGDTSLKRIGAGGGMPAGRIECHGAGVYDRRGAPYVLTGYLG